jgi:hypothetical protein
LFFTATHPQFGNELWRVGAPLAQTGSTTWNGSADTSWTNAANWSNGVPDATKTVVIPSGMPRYPVLAIPTSVKSLTIENGAAITINAGINITILNN